MLPRRLSRPAVVGPVLVWALVLGLLPGVADGAAFRPAASGAEAGDVATLEARAVAAHLVGLGVDPGEAAARVSALSAAERHALAARLEEAQVGGNAAAALGIAIIVAALVILVLELMGRRVVSRP